MRFLSVLILPALLLGGWYAFAQDTPPQTQPEKICVCHVQDKKATTGRVIEVSSSALTGHLGHGDVQCTDCTNVGNACDTANGAACTSEPQTQTQPGEEDQDE